MSNTIAESKGIDLSKYHLLLSVDDDTGEKIIRVIDNTTGEVVNLLKVEDILNLNGEINNEVQRGKIPGSRN